MVQVTDCREFGRHTELSAYPQADRPPRYRARIAIKLGVLTVVVAIALATAFRASADPDGGGSGSPCWEIKLPQNIQTLSIAR
ncbi:hypothetical protein [Mycobacterium sp. D16R24]|uniref:hypothetical protein n=1 Tax=Mycobacterium sp. D16R24 TaxID=1855656 RepID=UPI0009929289|nr:hypothetical protein [Mycobacterium sp. D16R24]